MAISGPVDAHVISLLQNGDIKNVLPFLAQLQFSHNIDAIHDEINRFLNSKLWLAFLSNAAIQQKLSENKLKDMYLTAQLKAADKDATKEWQALLELLTSIKEQHFNLPTPAAHFKKAVEWEDIPTQCKILRELSQADSESEIFKMVLSSNHPAIWNAFINNRMITVFLLKTQYSQLVESLQTNVAGCHNEQSRKEWLILLALYALKLYPANYIEKICPDKEAADKTARFGILLDYAITQIHIFGKEKSQTANIETVRWLSFAMRLAEHPPTLDQWRVDPLFRQTLPFNFGTLSPALTIQFLNLFPIYITQLLKHIYVSKKEYGHHKHDRKYRELLALVKTLQAHAQFGVIINVDTQCCELLGVSPTPQSAQSSSSAMQTDDDDEGSFGLAPVVVELVDDTEPEAPMIEPDSFQKEDEALLEEVPLAREDTPLLAPQTDAGLHAQTLWQRYFTPCFKGCFARTRQAPTRQEQQGQCPGIFDAIVRFGQTRP